MILKLKFLLTYTISHTMACHPNKDGFLVESGYSQCFFLLSYKKKYFFCCYNHLWLAHKKSI